MACPTCLHTMHSLGKIQETSVFWCPHCGTIKTDLASHEPDISVPYLVDRVKRFRALANEGQGLLPGDAALWHRLGIGESIS